MKIEGYKKQFIELFKQLQEEYGKPESVIISTYDVCDDTGDVIESTPKCSIEF